MRDDGSHGTRPRARFSTQKAAVRLSLTPSPQAVREALAEAAAQMQKMGLNEDLRSNAEIVLAEVVNNIVEHAFAEGRIIGPEDPPIRLELRVVASGLRVSFQDCGGEMPGLTLPEGDLPALPDDIALLPEGGFGWFLIRELATGLRYRRQGRWNRLEMIVSDEASEPAVDRMTGLVSSS